MTRRTNTKLLKEWAEKNGDFAEAKLAAEAKISPSTAYKLLRDTYPAIPREPIRERLSELLGVTEDELFPPAPTGEEAS